jgi:GPH family glycoside/pentoside/hexuronide:cation symporter
MGQKNSLGLGMLANQMFPAALGIYIVLVQTCPVFCFFYPEYLMLLDPIMGFISDNTRSV